MNTYARALPRAALRARVSAHIRAKTTALARRLAVGCRGSDCAAAPVACVAHLTRARVASSLWGRTYNGRWGSGDQRSDGGWQREAARAAWQPHAWASSWLSGDHDGVSCEQTSGAGAGVTAPRPHAIRQPWRAPCVSPTVSGLVLGHPHGSGSWLTRYGGAWSESTPFPGASAATDVRRWGLRAYSVATPWAQAQSEGKRGKASSATKAAGPGTGAKTGSTAGAKASGDAGDSASSKGSEVGPPTLMTRAKAVYAYMQELSKDVMLGLKLMAGDIGFAVRLVGRSINRFDKLSRRERRHIRRTLVDLLKLLPFALVLALPGGSFAIPLCLRFAPGLLPSTFIKKVDKPGEPNMAHIKRHISSSLQSRVRVMVEELNVKQDREQNLERAFAALQNRDELGADQPHWEELAKTFTDQRVLDLVDTEELRVMFRLLGQRPVGGHALLSYRFIRSLEKLRLDDDLINRLGVDGLTFQEVFDACRRRGVSIPPLPRELRHMSMQDVQLLREGKLHPDVADGSGASAGVMAEPVAPADSELSGAQTDRVIANDEPAHDDDDAGGARAPATVRPLTTVAEEYERAVRERLTVWLDIAHKQGVPVALLLHLRVFVSADDEAAARDTTSNTRNALRALHELRRRHYPAAGAEGGDAVVTTTGGDGDSGATPGSSSGTPPRQLGDGVTGADANAESGPRDRQK